MEYGEYRYGARKIEVHGKLDSVLLSVYWVEEENPEALQGDSVVLGQSEGQALLDQAGICNSKGENFIPFVLAHFTGKAWYQRHNFCMLCGTRISNDRSYTHCEPCVDSMPVEEYEALLAKEFGNGQEVAQ